MDGRWSVRSKKDFSADMFLVDRLLVVLRTVPYCTSPLWVVYYKLVWESSAGGWLMVDSVS